MTNPSNPLADRTNPAADTCADCGTDLIGTDLASAYGDTLNVCDDCETQREGSQEKSLRFMKELHELLNRYSALLNPAGPGEEYTAHVVFMDDDVGDPDAYQAHYIYGEDGTPAGLAAGRLAVDTPSLHCSPFQQTQSVLRSPHRHTDGKGRTQ